MGGRRLKEGLTGGALLSARGREKGGEVDRVRERMVGRWVHRPSRGERKKRGRKQLGRLEEKKKKREKERVRDCSAGSKEIEKRKKQFGIVFSGIFVLQTQTIVEKFYFANSNNCSAGPV